MKVEHKKTINQLAKDIRLWQRFISEGNISQEKFINKIDPLLNKLLSILIKENILEE